MCQTENEKFVVDDLSKAEWALKKIVERQEEIAEKSCQAQQMKADYADKVDAWLREEVEKLSGDIAFFEACLEPFVLAELEKSGGKKKSISLPSGKCGYRKGKTKILFDGEEASAKNDRLKEWVKENHEGYIKTIETVDWKELKDCLDVLDDGRVMVDGEILEGFTVEMESPKFYVRGNA